MDGRLAFLGLVFAILILAWVGAGVLWRAAELAELVAPLDPADYDELSVVAVGTGSEFENPERLGPATAVGLGTTVVLVDAGRGIAEGLRLAKIPVDQPSVVFLTNLLPWNTVGLDDLLVNGWLTDREAPLRVVGPTGTRALVEGLVAAHAGGNAAMASALGLSEDGGRIDVVEVADGHSEAVGPITVDARRLPDGPLPTLAWRFSDGQSRVVVSGSGWGHETLASFAGGADVLVHEAAYLPTVDELEGTGAVVEDAERIERDRAFHTLVDAAGRLATAAQVDRLVLVRLRPPPFFEIQMTSLVGNEFGGEIVIPEDGELVFP
ncbi:MAG: MBL fold metallo-hydrolase [Myxococcota bacterium]